MSFSGILTGLSTSRRDCKICQWHYSSVLHLISSLTIYVLLAGPVIYASQQASTAQIVAYWGQSGETSLSSYCAPSSGIDVIVLAFLDEYGNSNNIASGTIGQSCYIDPSGEGQQCDALAADIDTCKSNGVKVILSLGGGAGIYSLQSEEQAKTIGQNLWDAYGNAVKGGVPRPFGNTFVDGWDFDIESSGGNQYYQYMISTLRSNFASDSSGQYYITGAPQCPIPEPNMNVIITNAQFDYLWVQFYNNPGCSVNGPINYDDWKTNIANTPSANAKIFIGVPASPLGATGTSSGAQYYLEPSALAALVGQYDSDAAFGGVMMWSAGISNRNVNNGCTYAQEAKNILSTGAACGGSEHAPSHSTTTPATTTTATHTSTTSPTPSSSALGANCPIAGVSCPTNGAFACTGSSFGICDNGAWVIESCGSGEVCVPNGSGIYCGIAGINAPVCA